MAAALGRRMLLMSCLVFRAIYPSNRLGISPEYVRAYSPAGRGIAGGRPAPPKRPAVPADVRHRRRARRPTDGGVCHLERRDHPERRPHRRGRGPRDPAPGPHRARPLAGRPGVPLGRERAVHIPHVLRLPAGVAGLVRAGTRTGGQPRAGAQSPFLVAGAAGWAMLGRGEDTAAQLRAARDVLADQPDNRDAWMAYIGAALMAAVEQSQLGEEFESVVAEMERIRPNPRRVWPTLRIMWVYLAQGRLAQCMAASEQERPARLAAARTAIRELRRAASMPIIRAHYLILQGAYRQLTGDHQRRAAAAGAGREDRSAAGRADPGLRDRPRARPGAAVPR